METRCIRCNKNFPNSAHPLANFYTVCFKCRKKNEETLLDQQSYNLRQYFKLENK